MRRRVEQEEISAKLVERYRNGDGLKALAAEFGMHHRTVRKRVEAAGVEPHDYRVLTEAQVEIAKSMYEQGASMQSIGDRLGVSHTTIRRYLRRLGVQSRRLGR